MSVRRRINVYVTLLVASLVVLVGVGGGFMQWRATTRAHIRSVLDGYHLVGQQRAAEAEVLLLRIREVMRPQDRDGRPAAPQVDAGAQQELATARYLLRDHIRQLAEPHPDPVPLLQWQVERVTALHESFENQLDQPGSGPDAQGNLSAGLFGALEQLRLLHAIEYRALARELDEMERTEPLELAGLIGVLAIVGIALMVRLLGLIGTALRRQEQAEAGLMALTGELERRVQERSAQLEAAQEQLLRRERLAVIGQLTATVTHELRNPIATLVTSMYVLREQLGDVDATAMGVLERMERSVGRCDRIVTELLDFSRTRDLILMPVVVDAFIEAALAELERPPWLAFAFHGGLGNLRLPVDSDRLRRALINLHDNAVQAMEIHREQVDGYEPRLEVITRRVGDEMECRVIDNGPGMSDEVQAHAFEPLYSNKRSGVGLGLPIVRQAIEQQGGTVELQSVLGQGTTFTIRLPLHPPAGDGPD